MYLESDLVGIARRENNNKRKYLVVNKLQGKHVPVKPSKALEMFGVLADMLAASYSGEKLLLVGFAETATAIGAAVAAKMECYYIQTTREVIEGADYLFFSESHSHATEQKLAKSDIESVIERIDRIVFVEDEVTTGNTIMNIVEILKKNYKSSKVKYAVASILNGMGEMSEENFRKNGIGMHYLVKTDHSAYEEAAMKFSGSGVYHGVLQGKKGAGYSEEKYGNYLNARRIVDSRKYLHFCDELWRNISYNRKEETNRKVLVLGTEEFMFPALYAASKIEEAGNSVYFHATTRSPILISSEEEYPLHSRFELRSLYDSDRVTYIYELDRYDCCYIITDAPEKEQIGLDTLISALSVSGNDDIRLVRWC